MFNQAVTTISVRDLNTSLAFYRDVLGFRIVHRVYDRLVHLAAAGMLIALRPLDGDPDLGDTSHVHIGLIVTDLEAARLDLETRGVFFLGETVDAKIARIAFFNDPDGTPLYLCQWSHWVESAA